MLEWLKTILGDAYTQDIDKKVSAEIGKAFVSKSDFNTVNETKKQLETALSERDAQLESLKSSNGDIDTLRKQITELQAQNTKQSEEHAEAIKQLKLDSAVDAALMAAKARNVTAARALLDLSNLELAEDGTVKGLTNQIKALADSPGTGFLFDSDTRRSGSFKGLKPGEKGDGAPAGGAKETKDMSYDELCEYLAENPDTQL